MGAIKEVTLTGTVNGSNKIFSTGQPYTTVLFAFADNTYCYPGQPGGFTLTNPSAGVVTFADAPTLPAFQPTALIEDTSASPTNGIINASVFANSVICNDMYYQIGSTKTYAIVFTTTALDGTKSPTDLTGASVFFGMKALLEDSYPQLITKNTTAGGIIINTPATAGLAMLTLSPPDAIGNYPGSYEYGITAVLAGGSVQPGDSARFHLQGRGVIPT